MMVDASALMSAGYDHGFYICNVDGSFVWHPFGLIHTDLRLQPNGSQINTDNTQASTFLTRRLRLGFEGQLYGNIDYDNRYWKALCYFFAVLTLFGRIYHDQHWLSDVILGGLIPTVIGIKLNRINKNEMSNVLMKQTIN